MKARPTSINPSPPTNYAAGLDPGQIQPTSRAGFGGNNWLHHRRQCRGGATCAAGHSQYRRPARTASGIGKAHSKSHRATPINPLVRRAEIPKLSHFLPAISGNHRGGPCPSCRTRLDAFLLVPGVMCGWRPGSGKNHPEPQMDGGISGPR